MTNRRVDPIRVTSTVYGAKRQHVHAQLDQARADIRHVDQELAALRRRRRDLAATIRAHRTRLWPTAAWRGRQPGPDGSEQLPPAPHDAPRLWGRRLRAQCRAILAAVRGPLELPQLHAMLHDHGFLIRSRHVVKALSDAMSYEVENGRARRIARGTYELLGSGRLDS